MINREKRSIAHKGNCLDRQALLKSHKEDATEYKRQLVFGEELHQDIKTIEALISEISESKTVSKADKENILTELSLIVNYIQSEYKLEVEDSLVKIAESLQLRIKDIDCAADETKEYCTAAEKRIWHSNAVNKKKIVSAYNELYKKYSFLLKETSHDLFFLMKEAKEQRARIQKHNLRR